MHSYLLAFLLLNEFHATIGFSLTHKLHVGPRRLSLLYSKIRNKPDAEVEELIPEDNPTVDPNQKSLSGTTYGDVLSGLHKLYPPKELSQRNAISRTDGYWKYIEAGKKPPSHFTYGEFDFLFFSELIDRSNVHYNNCNRDNNEPSGNGDGWEGKTFLDIGSGTGRLVIGAAALHPGLKLCKGLEILPGIHEVSLKNLERCRKSHSVEDISIDVTQDSADEQNIEEEENENEEGSDQEYEEQLCGEMGQMQKALQEMTAEEWKTILGDMDLEDLLDDGDADDENITNEEEGNDEDISDDEELMLDNEQNQNTTVNNMRQIEHWISSTFSLPSDVSLVTNIEDVDEDPPEHHFDSIDEFTKLTQQQWVEIYGDTATRYCPDRLELDVDGSLEFTNDPDNQGELVLHSHEEESDEELPLAPIMFSCGSFQDPYEYIGDTDIIFVFSSCMTDAMMGDLSDCIGRQCKPGTIVISTEFKLNSTGVISPMENDPEMPHGDYEIELVEEVEGWNWVMGKSTAYIHRVTKSLWDGSGPRTRPRIEPEEMAWRTIRDMESRNLTDSDKFMRQVNNNMVFHSIQDIIQTELEFYAREEQTTDNGESSDDAPDIPEAPIQTDIEPSENEKDDEVASEGSENNVTSENDVLLRVKRFWTKYF